MGRRGFLFPILIGNGKLLTSCPCLGDATSMQQGDPGSVFSWAAGGAAEVIEEVLEGERDLLRFWQ